MGPQKVLQLSNVTLLITFVAFWVSVVIAYGFETELPMMLIAVLHVLQLILAGLVKVAYVVRLVSQKQLGMAVE